MDKSKQALIAKIQEFLKIPVSDIESGDFFDIHVYHGGGYVGDVQFLEGKVGFCDYAQKMSFKWRRVFELNKLKIESLVKAVFGIDEAQIGAYHGRYLIVMKTDEKGFEIVDFKIEWFHDGTEWQVVKV